MYLNNIKKWHVIIVVVAIIITICVVFAVIFKNPRKEKPKIIGDTGTKAGTIYNVTTSKKYNPELFTVSINSKIYVKNKKALAYIKNDKNNIHKMKVILKDSTTKKTIYTSKILKPGTNLDEIYLNTDYSSGEHKAVAEFYAIDNENKTVGSAIVEVVVVCEI